MVAARARRLQRVGLRGQRNGTGVFVEPDGVRRDAGGPASRRDARAGATEATRHHLRRRTVTQRGSRGY